MNSQNLSEAGAKRVAPATNKTGGSITVKVIVTCFVINTIVAVVDIAVFKPDLIKKGVRKMKNLLKPNKEQ